MTGDSARDPATEFARLAQVIAELRVRCPWDREQSIQSLSKHLLEEAYEAADAIARGESRQIADELGDLLAQLLAITVIADEQGSFSLNDLLAGAADKLIRRHPHVYGEAQATTSAQVVDNWNLLKQDERKQAGATSALDGIARALPALSRAQKLGTRAREAGMDWPDIHAVLGKVREEIEETEGALSRNDPDEAAEELGDMMLALANAPRFVGHDAEETLRRACEKFIARFAVLEKLAAARQLDLKALSEDAIEALWQEAKVLAAAPKNPNSP